MLSQVTTVNRQAIVDVLRLEIVYKPTGWCKEYGRNPRRNDEAVDRMCASILEFGFVVPMLCRSSGLVVDGHLRLKSARKLGMQELPVVLCDHWTESQVKAFRLMVNRSVTWAEFDEGKLALELQELRESDFDLSLTGFESDELARLLAAQDAAEGLTDEDAVPELPQTPVSVPGDFFMLGDHRLLVGDATVKADVERLMAGDAADLVFSDLPYNAAYEGYTKDKLTIKNDNMGPSQFDQFLRTSFASFRPVVKPGASLYICHSSSFQREFQNALEAAGFEVRCQIIWAKNTFAWGFGRYKFQHEPIFYCHVAGQKDFWYGDKTQSTLWQENKPAANRLHPTMKPVELIERALLNSSKTGDIVVDLFGGSGSTLIGCERRHRRARLMEIDPKYREMVRCERLASGDVKRIAVANFKARIVRNLILDDDAEQRRELGIEAELGGQRLVFVVPAAEFGRMGWVLRQLGPEAIVYPGQQQHARAAIQWLSGPIPQERVYTHLGWKKYGPDWVYLQSGGAIAAQGLRTDLQVQLPAPLTNYRVTLPSSTRERKQAVLASLSFLSLAADWITLPLLAGVYRAALGSVPFSLFLTGPSGSFKTAMAAICQQHLGTSMDASHLPANFASTANALEELAYLAKDSLLVVDDFVPAGGLGDAALHALAERLFRSAGNHQGRNRMDSSSRLRAARPPRALLLATGEQVPRGQSLRARLLMIDVGPGDVHPDHLSACQCAGDQGQLATAMGAFLAWVASRYDDLQARLSKRTPEHRSQSLHSNIPARVPHAVAELQSGWEIWLQFAVEAGAISKKERNELARRAMIAFDDLATRQAPYQQDRDNPVAGSNKKAQIIAMLKRPQGAKLVEIMEATGWQKHSVPGRAIFHPCANESKRLEVLVF